jgi:hypothetical protein
MKVLGKVWKDRVGLTLDFYIERGEGKGWWKTNTIKLTRSNKRFNLQRLFSLFATRIDYPFSRFKREPKPMWEREFEVEEEVVVSLMNKKRKGEIWKSS